MTGIKTETNRVVTVPCRPEHFANRDWPHVARRTLLEAAQLMRCPFYAIGRIAAGASQAVAAMTVVLVGTVDQPLYRGPIEQLHDASLDLDQAFALKAREQPAHGLQLQSQVTADFLARHP